MNSQSMKLLAIVTATVISFSGVGYMMIQEIQADVNANGNDANGINADGENVRGTGDRDADGTTDHLSESQSADGANASGARGADGADVVVTRGADGADGVGIDGAWRVRWC